MNESDLPAEAAAAGPFTPAFSYSNDVWIGREAVLRLSRTTGPDARQERERRVLAMLPPAVPHADVLAHGQHGGRDWLLLRRAPGQVLGRAWPIASLSTRRALIDQLGEALRALHALPVPDWLGLDPDAGVRQFQQPPSQIETLANAAAALPGVDRDLVAEAAAFVRVRLPLFTEDEAVVVHADLHWENLMVEGDRLSALLDFETTRPAAPDLELDVLLRFCRWPHLPVAKEYEQLMLPVDFGEVPAWLAAAYPALFAGPHVRERLEAYAVMYDLRLGMEYPERPGEREWSPWTRLRDLLAGRGYLDGFANALSA